MQNLRPSEPSCELCESRESCEPHYKFYFDLFYLHLYENILDEFFTRDVRQHRVKFLLTLSNSFVFLGVAMAREIRLRAMS